MGLCLSQSAFSALPTPLSVEIGGTVAIDCVSIGTATKRKYASRGADTPTVLSSNGSDYPAYSWDIAVMKTKQLSVI